jgi:hypothetical protein
MKEKIIKKYKIKSNIVDEYFNNLGPAFPNLSLCTNKDDVVTLKPIIEYNFKDVFSFTQNDIIYGFYIKSLDELLKINNKNPFTRQEIPKEALQRFQFIKQIHSFIVL